VVCAEAEEIGPRRTGSATGVVISLANIGAVVIPTAAGYVLRSLKTAGAADYRLAWGLVALSMFMIIVFTTLLRETGARAGDA
jgi:fucose permease